MENSNIVSNENVNVGEVIADVGEVVTNPAKASALAVGIAITSVVGVGIITYKIVKNIVAIVKAKKEQKQLSEQSEVIANEDVCEDGSTEE